MPQSLTPSRAHDAQAGRRLSVCLCLSGQMRSFEDNFGWVAAATEALDLSIVVSTWTERGGKLHGDQKPERLRSVFPYAVTDALPPSWLNLDLLEALPGLRAAALARARDAQVTEPMIHAALPGALIHLEPPLRFAWFEMQRLTSGNPRGSDPFSMQMLYKVWQADLMRRNLEAARGRRFDVVVRARPDRPPRSLDPAFLSRIKPGEIWVQDLYPKRRYIGDMLALGCSRSMDVYGGFFLEAVRRAEADAWTYIHSDLYEYLAGRGLALRGC